MNNIKQILILACVFFGTMAGLYFFNHYKQPSVISEPPAQQPITPTPTPPLTPPDIEPSPKPIDGYVAPNYPEALKKAKETNTNMLVFFTASWCGPCQSLKAMVRDDPKVQDAIKPYIVCYVDVDTEKELVRKFLGVNRSIPQYAVIDKDENILKKGMGNKSADKFCEWLAR